MKINIAGCLQETARDFKTKTAIIENGKEISYQRLWLQVERLAASLVKLGIHENDRVVIVLPNGADFVCFFFALLKIYAVVIPLNPDSTLFEIKKILDSCKPHAILALPTCMSKIIHEPSPSFNNQGRVVKSSSEIAGITGSNQYELKKIDDDDWSRGNAATFDHTSEHVAGIHYTYRGEGYPLGAMLGHNSYREGTLAYIANTRMAAHHTVLLLLPLSHVYSLVGCLFAPLMSGARIIISENYLPRSIMRIIESYNINHITLVPSIYTLLLQHYKKGQYNLETLNCCITGGAFMGLDMLEKIKEKMDLEIFQGYGLSECLPVTWNRYEHNRPGTLGLPLRNDFKLAIIGDDGVHKNVNEIGEIIVKSPTVMQGYYNDRKSTEHVLRNGWLYTGDYGYLDSAGYLHFSGLKKNVAKVGGNMVDLAEVRDVLLSHPFIAEALVCSEGNELWGHVVKAKIVSRANGHLTVHHIKSYCNNRLSRHKVPREIEFTVKVN